MCLTTSLASITVKKKNEEIGTVRPEPLTLFYPIYFSELVSGFGDANMLEFSYFYPGYSELIDMFCHSNFKILFVV